MKKPIKHMKKIELISEISRLNDEVRAAKNAKRAAKESRDKALTSIQAAAKRFALTDIPDSEYAALRGGFSGLSRAVILKWFLKFWGLGTWWECVSCVRSTCTATVSDRLERRCRVASRVVRSGGGKRRKLLSQCGGDSAVRYITQQRMYNLWTL